MGDVITFDDGQHGAVQRLIPWYVTGQLDPDEKLVLERHIGRCAVCAGMLDTERQLRSAIAGMSLGADQGWDKLKQRLNVDPVPSRVQAWATFVTRPRTMRRFIAAQAACLLLLGGLTWQFASQPRYQALGNAPAAHVGNALVMFRADATEQELRRSLKLVNARLVDGPTTANAYLIKVPAPKRDAELARLRADRAVTMAEPVDAGTDL